jgi:hypothetical protein
VSVAPYDVKLSGFAGGAVVLLHVLEQIILKDLLFLNRDETLAAAPLLAGGNGRQRLANFSAQTYGVRAGGAVVKDINCFILLTTKTRQSNATTFELSTYTGLSGVD